MNGVDCWRNVFSDGDRLLSRRADGRLFVCPTDWKTACITKDDEAQSPVTVHLPNSLMDCSSRYQLLMALLLLHTEQTMEEEMTTRSDTHGWNCRPTRTTDSQHQQK